MRFQASIGAIAISLLALGAAACGDDKKPAVTPATPPPAPQPTAVQTTSAAPVKTDNLKVSADLRSACNITDTPHAPKFDFDSAQLTENDRSLLDQVAQCLTTGPLKGRTVELIGRADSRGEQEYNMNLGSSRAASAVTYLGQLGVPKAQMRETSRGALDATGKDEAGWQQDRRVDVTLVK